MTKRGDEIRAAVATVQDRIERACAQVNRPPETVKLLPVTKRFPASDAAELARLGLLELAFVELLETITTGGSAYARRYGRGFWEDLDEHPELR
ncbi:hypothetical protein ACFQ1S_42385, partial [Kibdelosporangium lantanae]